MEDGQPEAKRLAARLDELERRVETIEARLQLRTERSTAPSTGRQLPDSERFWALAGLRERIGDGSAVLFTGSVSLPGDRVYVWQQGADAGQLLEADWEAAADVLAALGHPVRLKLARAVLRGAGTTTELAALAGLGTTGQLYHHLRQLVAAGWLTSAGRGRYEVPAVRVIPLLVVLCAAGGWSPPAGAHST
ncbi:MAG TPA: helix-turn-helix domain-containing protein [Solirubrobacteraceae bacterium]|nr:helix-turn-helix domain-containing protein [Solirubrobacteraceae bacterium]